MSGQGRVDTLIASVAKAKPVERKLTFERASGIKTRPVKWAWDTALPGAAPQFREGRFPVGSLALAVGRAGVGKSQFACWAAARITTGTLPGEFFGTPRGVVYAATEDSWSMTIVPRLMAAGADVDLVYRVAVADDGDEHASLTLPVDTAALELGIAEHEVALVVLDPLLSMVDASVNDYRAREVRTALEPLVAMADRTGVVLLGLAHFTKGTGNDPLLLVSGSAAFGQLVRAAVAFARDDNAISSTAGVDPGSSYYALPYIDDMTVTTVTTGQEPQVSGAAQLLTPTPFYVCSQIKNNLGRDDLPSLAYRIEPSPVNTDEGEAWTSRLEFTGASARSVRDVLSSADEPVGADERSERKTVGTWLREYLTDSGDVPSAQVKKAFADAGLGAMTSPTLARARNECGVQVTSKGFPRTTYWSLPVTAPVVSPPLDWNNCVTTVTTEPDLQKEPPPGPSRYSRSTLPTNRESGTTEPDSGTTHDNDITESKNSMCSTNSAQVASKPLDRDTTKPVHGVDATGKPLTPEEADALLAQMMAAPTPRADRSPVTA